MRIARRFNAGNVIARDLSPEGTVETERRGVVFSRPYGTCSRFPGIPALKRRAIIAQSVRDDQVRIPERQ